MSGDSSFRFAFWWSTIIQSVSHRNSCSCWLPESDMKLVGQASNGRETIHQIPEYQPDITLMDLQMPEIDGLDAMIAIPSEFPEARIIVFTTYAGGTSRFMRAIKAGARAYLLKSLLYKELLADHSRRACRAQKSCPPDVAVQIAEHSSEES